MKTLDAALVAAAVLAFAGCDIPTEAPIIEERWVIPMESTSVSVAEFLPAGVSIVGSNFSVSLAGVTIQRSLGELCPSCAPLNGLTVPVPPFTGTFSQSEPLPARVASATIVSGSVRVTITNGFGFDPLQNGGSLTLVVRDGVGGRELGRSVIEGAGTFATAAPVIRTISIAPGNIGAALLAEAVLASSGGMVARIDVNSRLSVNATTTSLLVSSAMVNVAGTAVDFDPVDLDVGDVDTAITDHIVQGAIIVDLVNPFGVSIAARLDIDYPGGRLSKSFSVPAAATSSTSVPYTGDELRLFLGKEGVRLTGVGTVSASAGPVRLTPVQELLAEGSIDLTLTIGG